jgi:pantoate--beta-alanine ligase
MKRIADPKRFQKEMERLRLQGKTVGFVPTMGALHEGHLSLFRRARKENKVVAASIFVNPTQFGPKEDFKKYPRPMAADMRLLQKEGVQYLFAPSAEAMYPEGAQTTIDPGNLGAGLCGKFRPGHFAGVATVVAKLFHIAKPHRVYFGAKDYQQAMIIRRLIEDLNFDIEFRLCPTVREKDGMAMSSRNRYLSAEERARAVWVSKVLFDVRRQVLSGRRDILKLKQEARRELSRHLGRLQYFEVVDPLTLEPLRKFQPWMVAAAACFAGKTRLIDNVIILPSAVSSQLSAQASKKTNKKKKRI